MVGWYMKGPLAGKWFALSRNWEGQFLQDQRIREQKIKDVAHTQEYPSKILKAGLLTRAYHVVPNPFSHAVRHGRP